MLAGVVNSPYWYDPHYYLDHATSRRNNVLYMMWYHGYITEEQYNLAKSIRVEDTLIDPSESRSSTVSRHTLMKPLRKRKISPDRIRSTYPWRSTQPWIRKYRMRWKPFAQVRIQMLNSRMT